MTLHADRGSSMKSNAVGQLLMDLGVTKTHSRPHVSNDNPYSESLFKTLKYRPDFPLRSLIQLRRLESSACVSLGDTTNIISTQALHILRPMMFTMEEWTLLFQKGRL